MSDKGWKAAERLVASVIAGRRLFFGGSEGDAASRWCVADVKRRKTYSLGQARVDLAKLPQDRRLPIVVHFDVPGRGRKGQPLVILRLEDFRDWFGGNPPAPESGRSGEEGPLDPREVA